MTTELKLLGEEFASPTRELVRVHPGAFGVKGATYARIRATISSWTLVRKLFREERLVCRSNDGERSSTGTTCDPCPSRAACSRRLRLTLEEATGVPWVGSDGAPQDVPLGPLVLELNFTSSQNFLAYARHLDAVDLEVPELPVRLAVVDHATWGEVCFTRSPNPLPDGQP